MKLCLKCNVEKDVTEFHKNKSKPDGLQVHCKSCKKLVDALHYKNFTPEQKHRRDKNRSESKQVIKDYKKGCICLICGESEPCCLDFHHLRDKKVNVSQMGGQGFSEKLILEEISKCIVLCANCHRKIHGGIIKLPC